ncbi:MAG: ATP-dependent zinc metalloprotease FtsH [Bacillota bacterium]
MLGVNNQGFLLGTQEYQTTVDEFTYADLVQELDEGNVKEVVVQRSKEVSDFATADITLTTGRTETINILSSSTFQAELDKYALTNPDMKINIMAVEKESLFMTLLPSLLMMLVMVLVFTFLFSRMQGGGGKMSSFGKSKAKMSMDDENKVTFDHVAGCNEEKGELEELVEFLRTPKKFTEIGAKIPKGVLLVGPPGTGKTLLAKAVAGEAGVPFFSISGSDFVEMFVGVGASRVRDLFEQAKKMSPSIVFIDEIDAVGRRRGAGLGGGHDEREQTLNQLLVEMDGFGVNESVIIIAATNRADILDPALLRPGRFDRQVYVGRPDVKGREAILQVHAKDKKIAKEVDLYVVAQTTGGFTGADLANLLNEAALLSARENKKEVDMEEIQKALVKIGVGTEKKTRIIPEKEKNITAYHEAGHAILFEILSELDPVHSISVIPTGRAGGYTMPLPGEDKMYLSKLTMEQEIVCFMGGRAAEFIIIKDITTGASNDIQRASSMARGMVMQYGMSDVLGPIQFGEESQEVFIGRDWGSGRNYSESVATTIDAEVKRIMDWGYAEAIRLLKENMEVLHATAKMLVLKEKITGEEFRDLFDEEKRAEMLGIAEEEAEKKTKALEEIAALEGKQEKVKIVELSKSSDSEKKLVEDLFSKLEETEKKLGDMAEQLSSIQESKEPTASIEEDDENNE